MSALLSARMPQIFVGEVRDRWPGKPPSAIGKTAVMGSRHLTTTGLEGDAQADLDVHGGEGKAIHHYPADHYPLWRAELSDVIDVLSPRFQPGGFGENMTTLGLNEYMVCIGDVFRWGTATIQISQGRQPCWKLAAHTGVPQMAYLVQKKLWTGWHYRVLEEGQVRPGDDLILAARPHPGFSVARVTGARLSRTIARAEALELASLAALEPGWRAAFQEKANGMIEDQGARLGES